jgi:hypothetical protein
MTPSRLNPIAVVGAFLLLTTLVALFGRQPASVAVDQNLFHLPAVRQFAGQWPHVDLSNYSSATSPGYHLVLAAAARFVSNDVVLLRLVGATFGVALVFLLASAAADRNNARAAWLALPLATSYYVINSTAWALPDNAAWLLLTIALLLAIRTNGWPLYAGSAAVLALLVFTRQSHAWALLPFAVGAGLSGRIRTATGPSVDPIEALRPVSNAPSSYLRTALLAGVAMLPALAVLAWLVSLWHGLTPPAFRPGSGVDLPLATKMGGVAPAAPAMVLALIGLFGTPLLAWVWPTARSRRVVRLMLLGAAAGFVVGILPETTYNDLSRRSGLWNLVLKLPTVGGRSPLIVGLATLGGAVVAAALARLPVRERSVLAAALAGFTLVQAANGLVWQRYYEPFVLIWLILAAAAGGGAMGPTRRKLAVAGLAAVTAFQTAALIYALRSGG